MQQIQTESEDFVEMQWPKGKQKNKTMTVMTKIVEESTRMEKAQRERGEGERKVH